MGWKLDRRTVWEEISNRGTVNPVLYKAVVFILRVVAPIGIALIFINELGLF